MEVTGLPWTVTMDFHYGKNRNSSEGKAYYYVKLKLDKSSASVNALSNEEKKSLKTAIRLANKALKQKENRVTYSIERLDLGEFAFEKEKSSSGEYVFAKKDGSGDTLVWRKRGGENMDDSELKDKAIVGLIATFSGDKFVIPKSEYKKTVSTDGITITGKEKNLTGVMTGSLK